MIFNVHGVVSTLINTFSFRIISNYHASPDVYVDCNDLVNKANLEKENIGCNSQISSKLLCKAVKEVFPDVEKRKIRRNKERVFVFNGLTVNKRNEQIGQEADLLNYKQEWNMIVTEANNIIKEKDNWSVKQGELAICFIHVEDVRFERQLVVSEVLVELNESAARLDFQMKFHEKEVPQSKLNEMLRAVKSSSITEKLCCLMAVMETSYMCTGFDIGDEESLYGVELKRYKLSSVFENNEPAKLPRSFSPSCHVLANSGGFQCDSSSNTNKNLNRKRKRHEDRINEGKELDTRTNHRSVIFKLIYKFSGV